MDIPFIYDRYVTNKDFTGRKSERLALTSLIAADENIVLYEPPKSGKKSLVQQTLFEMRIAGRNFCASGTDRECGNQEHRSVSGRVRQDGLGVPRRHLLYLRQADVRRL